MAKANGKKRTSPSVERQLALALLRVIECAGQVTISDKEQEALPELQAAITSGITVLDAKGYANMESIPTRVARIESAIADALKEQDGAKLAQLGAALDRAKRGLPPLATEKKPRKKVEKPAPGKPEQPKQRKRRQAASASNPANEIPSTAKCVYPDCNWAGPTPPDMACPVCGTEVVTDSGGKVVVA